MKHPELCICVQCWNAHLDDLSELEREIIDQMTPSEILKFRDGWKGGIDAR